MTQSTTPKNAIITGASSGIGHALARELARRGYGLGITARRADALEELAGEIGKDPGAGGASVEVRRLDVQDSEAVRTTIHELAATMGGVGTVVVNAGIAINRQIASGNFERDESTIRTNLIGAMATIDAAAEVMKAARAGQIVVISSVAAYRGLPGNAAYSASKAGIAAYAEAARAELRRYGVQVTTLFPGFIDTPLNRSLKSRPFLISVEAGAKQIADLVERGVRSSTVPVWPWTAIGYVMRGVPDFAWDRIVGGPARSSSSKARD